MENNMYYPAANNGYYTQPTQPRMQPKNTQPLTEEEIKMLQASSSKMSMEIPKEEFLRAKCTHKYTNGNSAAINMNADIRGATPHFRCEICGQEWDPANESLVDIDNIINNITNIFQTIKLVYTDAPVELISTYSQIMPLIKRLGAMWQAAIACNTKYSVPANNQAYNNVPNVAYGTSFQQLNTLMTNPGAAAYMQQPYAQPYAYQPQYMQQPYAQPAYGNPMAYGTPMAAPQAQQPMQAPSVGAMPQAQQPMQPQPAPQPAPQAQTTQAPTDTQQNTASPSSQAQEIQQTKTFSV